MGRIARQQLEVGRLQEAVENIGVALKARPGHPLLRAIRGLVNARLEKCPEAIRDFKMAMRNLSSFEHELSEHKLLLARGRCHEQSGRSDAAIADYRKLVNATGAKALAKEEFAAAQERLRALGVGSKENAGGFDDFEDDDDEFRDDVETAPDAG